MGGLSEELRVKSEEFKYLMWLNRLFAVINVSSMNSVNYEIKYIHIPDSAPKGQ